MQAFSQVSLKRFRTPLACALAVLALVFLLQVTPHGHSNGQDEAACRLCQAAHISVTPALSGIVLSVPLVPVGEIAAPLVGPASETYLAPFDSRGPPSEVQL